MSVIKTLNRINSKVELSREVLELGKLQDLGGDIKKALAPIQNLGSVLSGAASDAKKAAKSLSKTESEAKDLVSKMKDLGVGGSDLKKAEQIEEEAGAFKGSMEKLSSALDKAKKANFG